MDDKNIRRYLEDNLFVLNHMDDNHTLKNYIELKLIIILFRMTYEYIQYYCVSIYEKIPNIHFHNVNNLIHQQLVDNNKNWSLNHMIIVMNQLNDNYNILSNMKNMNWL
jgi:hypothetical protein